VRGVQAVIACRHPLFRIHPTIASGRTTPRLDAEVLPGMWSSLSSMPSPPPSHEDEPPASHVLLPSAPCPRAQSPLHCLVGSVLPIHLRRRRSWPRHSQLLALFGVLLLFKPSHLSPRRRPTQSPSSSYGQLSFSSRAAWITRVRGVEGYSRMCVM